MSSEASSQVVDFSEKPAALPSIPGVELFAVGTHRDNKWTEKDLDTMVRNEKRWRHLLKPPIKIGHEEKQALAEGVFTEPEDQQPGEQNTGLPKIGSVRNLSKRVVACPVCKGKGRIPGEAKGLETCPECNGSGRIVKLLGDLIEVNPKLAQMIQNRAYDKISIEIYPEPPEGIPGEGVMLRAASVLGGELPQLKTLADLPMPQYSEGPRLYRPVTLRFCESRQRSGYYQVFSEVTKMNPEEQLKKLAEAGWNPEVAKTMSPEQMGEACRMAEEMAPPPKDMEVQAEEDDDDDDDEEAKKKAAMAEGEHDDDDEAHEAMSEDDVGKIDEDKRSEFASRYAEKAYRYAALADKFAMDNAQRAGMFAKADEKGAARTGKKRSYMGMKNKWPTKSSETQRFSETDVRRIVNVAKEEIRKEFAGVRKQTQQLAANTRRANIVQFCESMVAAGYLLPAQVEQVDPKGKVQNVWTELMRADSENVVLTFSEKGKAVGMTELDLKMKAIREGPKLARYAERAGVGKNGNGQSDEELAKVQRFSETPRFSQVLEVAGKTPTEYVEGFKKAKEQNPRLTAEMYGASA